MKKNTFLTLLLLCLIMALSLTSCDESPKYGSLTINLDDATRTIQPANLDCDRYEIWGYRVDGGSTPGKILKEATKDNKSNIQIDKLLIGDWYFYAKGFNSDNKQIAQSDEEKVTISTSSPNSTSLQLKFMQSTTGTVNLNFMIKNTNKKCYKDCS